MHKLKRIFRTDNFLRVFFEDGSVRTIDIALHLNVPGVDGFTDEPNLSEVTILPQSHAILWDDGTELTADYLYHNSRLAGWVVETWGDDLQAWQPVSFTTAEIKVDVSTQQVHAYLLLDDLSFPALRISSASFGIHENIPWYHVPFPGNDGEYEPEWEEPPIVFDTLELLVRIAKDAIERKTGGTINITDHLLKTGMDLRVESLSPREAARLAGRFKKNAAT